MLRKVAGRGDSGMLTKVERSCRGVLKSAVIVDCGGARRPRGKTGGTREDVTESSCSNDNYLL